MMRVFVKQSRIAASAERVFEWHEQPEALTKLIPPGTPARVVEHTGGIRDGARVVIEMGYRPFTIRWVALHQNYIAGRQFQDVQVSGPMKFWRHTHLFIADGDGCILRDHVEFELPMPPLGEIAWPMVRSKLEKMFEYRHRVTAEALAGA